MCVGFWRAGWLGPAKAVRAYPREYSILRDEAAEDGAPRGCGARCGFGIEHLVGG